MENKFVLCQGVSVNGTDNMRSEYCLKENGAEGILSADVIFDAACGFIRAIPQPLFFFLELYNDDTDSYDTYYLDNCTREVALAVMKRYGELLINDGTVRFGFGSHSSEEEIYFTDYQEFSVYSQDVNKIRSLMKKLRVYLSDKPASLWDLFSDDNPGCLSTVEVDGETVRDIPVNLKQAGMYKAE